MKFQIGETVYWVDASANYGKSVPCKMCYGNKFVTIILGDDSKEKIECGYCSHGFESPSGSMKTWEPNSSILHGEIVGVEKSSSSWRYKVGYHSLEENDLYKYEKDAEPKKQEELERVKKQSEERFKESFVSSKKNQIWSVGYHTSQIKNHERSIRWHKMRLCMIKEKK